MTWSFTLPVTGATWNNTHFDKYAYVKNWPTFWANVTTELQAVVDAAGLSGTSTSSETIASSGSFSLTASTDKWWVAGTPIRMALSSDAANKWVYGVVTSYNSSTGALVFTASDSLGSGTYSSWNITVSGAAGSGGDGGGYSPGGANRVIHSDGSSDMSDSSNLIYDGNNLGVNKATPDSRLNLVVDDTDDVLGAKIEMNDTTNNPKAFQIINSANSYSWDIVHSGTTQDAAHIQADSLTSGSLLEMTSNSNASNTRNLVAITNSHASAVNARLLTLTQLSNGRCLFVDNNGAGSSVEIDHDFNSSSDIPSVLVNVANAGTGNGLFADFSGDEQASATAVGLISHVIRIRIGGSTLGYIPVHASFT